MKKNLFPLFFFLLIATSCASNKPNEVDILKTTNINEIEEYLTKAHPQDPKRGLLKQRVIALKNAEWTKGAKNAKPMQARPIIVDMPDLAKGKNNLAHQELFKKLMSETSEEHKEKTKKLLNNMFSEDINNKEAIVLLRNKSDCNLILEISGKKFYNLAVPANGENFIVLDKDYYQLSGSVCDVKYKSSKDIKNSIVIVLGNPTEKVSTEKEIPNQVKPTTPTRPSSKGKALPSKGKKKK